MTFFSNLNFELFFVWESTIFMLLIAFIMLMGIVLGKLYGDDFVNQEYEKYSEKRKEEEKQLEKIKEQVRLGKK